MGTPAVESTLEWGGDLRFRGHAGAHELILDGNRLAGCSPMEALLLSLGGCMAIDVVHILGRMRAEPQSVRTRVTGTRADSEPRRYTRIELEFELSGGGLKPQDVERALRLSREKYCSVLHSLRPDAEIAIDFRIS